MGFFPDLSKVYVGIIRRSKEDKIYLAKDSHLVQFNLKNFFTLQLTVFHHVMEYFYSVIENI